MTSPMVSIWRVSNTSVKSVTNDRSTADIRSIDPEMIVTLGLDLLIERVERDTRLNETRVVLGADVQDLAHASSEVNDDRASNSGGRSSVSD